MRLLLISTLAALGLTVPAFAQYYTETPKGYKLSAPAAEAALGLSEDSAIRKAAESCSGIKLQCMFIVKPGMRSFFEVDRSSGVAVHEHSISALKSVNTTPPATDYLIEGQPIYVAFGESDSDGYNDCVVASFLSDGSSVEELDRFNLGADYCAGVYALDLTNDGVVDLAVPYATGAGGGGGVEVRSIVPTGGLAWFGNDELDSTLFSQTGSINLMDFDGDGDWEIETSTPVLCSACGYQWGDLYTFDSEANNWEIDMPKFAAYYKPQQDFYRQLNTAVQVLAASPASLLNKNKSFEAKYATQIGGKWYGLDVFMDGGRADRTWVSQLASLVDGWK
jgi:hypothetical protein